MFLLTVVVIIVIFIIIIIVIIMLGQWHISKLQNPHTGAVMEDGYSYKSFVCAKLCTAAPAGAGTQRLLQHQAETLAESLKCRGISADHC